MHAESKKVKGRRGRKGKQIPRRAAKDRKVPAPLGREGRNRAQESSFEPPDSYEELLSEPGDLPGSYGETRVVLLPVEPYLLHVYWEVASAQLEKASEGLGDQYERSQAILRFYDVTNVVAEGTNARDFFDMGVDLQQRNAYVRLQSPNRSYFVELGLKTEDGKFHPITRSDAAATPPAWASQGADEDYMLVAGDYDQLQKVPMPTDMKPPAGAASRGASRGEGGLPSGAERGRPPEDGGTGVERGEPFKPEVLSTQRVPPEKKKRSDSDLTEMIEKKVRFGVSSKV